ncbi:hypothetical protein [Microbulbifer sp.]|nr:hypothetical protein [Microbulbifer sp.]
METESGTDRFIHQTLNKAGKVINRKLTGQNMSELKQAEVTPDE